MKLGIPSRVVDLPRIPGRAGLALAAAALFFSSVGHADSSIQGSPKVSIDVRDGDVVGTILTLAEAGGLNVVISDEVRGTVTLRVQGVPVERALDMLLKIAGLAQVRDGPVIGILPREALLEQQRQEAEALALDRGPVRVEVVRLNYARAAEVAPVLATLLTQWGVIAADIRTNSLVIRDVPESPVFKHLGSNP